MHIYDQAGHHIGPNEKAGGLIEQSIPGVIYQRSQKLDFTHVQILNDGKYVVQLKGKRVDSAQLKISSKAGGVVKETFVFPDLPLTEKTVSNLTLDIAGQTLRQRPIVSLDWLGKNEFKDFPAETRLDERESLDTTPPTSDIEILDNNIVITARDDEGGSGIWRIYYGTSLEEFVTEIQVGQERLKLPQGARPANVYTGPVKLPRRVKSVWSFAIDRAGNAQPSLTVLKVSN